MFHSHSSYCILLTPSTIHVLPIVPTLYSPICQIYVGSFAWITRGSIPFDIYTSMPYIGPLYLLGTPCTMCRILCPLSGSSTSSLTRSAHGSATFHLTNSCLHPTYPTRLLPTYISPLVQLIDFTIRFPVFL